jgi:hypothetical protein
MTGDHGALALAERVLGLLDDGGRSATYKFALFTAILDLCIEKKFAHDLLPETLTTRHLAERVVELYWNHAVPYLSVGTLRQGGGPGQQAEIVRRIQEARADWATSDADTLFRARQRHGTKFRKLVFEVEWKLIEMPIPRLQVLGSQEDRFLYDYAWTKDIRRSTVLRYQRDQPGAFDNRLIIRPGVAEQLVRLNGILRPLFYREWAVMVARMNRLPEAELEQFLFGSDRVSLESVRRPLRDMQGNRCFYCESRITGQADVDHFIPWTRYPDDGLDNLVVAHPSCNNSKRDFLAAAEHVEAWNARKKKHDADLSALAADVLWDRDIDRTKSIATSIYSRLPASTRLWLAPSQFGPNERGRILAALNGL